MSANLDRFDRMLLGMSTPVAVVTPRAVVVAHPPVERDPVIHSKRGPKYVDHMPCPICGRAELGIEFHGELRSGAKIHTIAAHSAGARLVLPRQPRCLGAGLRVLFEAGIWRGVKP